MYGQDYISVMRIAAGTRAARILTAQPHCGPGLDPLEQSPENRTTYFQCMVRIPYIRDLLLQQIERRALQKHKMGRNETHIAK